jgi:hypothetical protein
VSPNLRTWWSLEKATSVADLLFKMAAFLAALAAANFFFFNPKLEMSSFRQSFIDEAVLRDAYAPQDVPPLVGDLIREYNQDNAGDLASGTNKTTTEKGLSFEELCARHRERIVTIFGTSSCADRPRYGEGFSYERWLLDRAHERFGNDFITTAVRNLYRATYFTSRVTVENTGNGKAINVQIGVPSGYRAAESFSVEADSTTQRDFETERGQLSPRPGENFSIAWEKDKAINPTLVTWVAAGLVVFFGLAVVGDFLRS